MIPNKIKQYRADMAEGEKLRTICEQYGSTLSECAGWIPMGSGIVYGICMWPQMNAAYFIGGVCMAFSGGVGMMSVVNLEESPFERLKIVRQTQEDGGRMDRDLATRRFQEKQIFAYAKGAAVMLSMAATLHGCGMLMQSLQHRPHTPTAATAKLQR